MFQKFLLRIKSNQNPIIRSNGLFVRDYIYVKDVVDAYLNLAEKMDDKNIIGQSFNFSTDQPFSVLDIAQEIIDLMDAKNLRPVIQNQATNEIPEQHLSSKKAKEILGWQAKYGVKLGLKETVEWYKSFFENKNNKINYEKNINSCCML
ncbi:GDP-mannose 4,6-dehydratase [Candidatus Babeliales bacterium]|nr:GDP-mannose 4,6-dehydratase [Candidatus Babeliales bacterium]